MQSKIPKQFLLLNQKPIAKYSFDLFLSLPQIIEMVVVCDASYQNHFDLQDWEHPLTFAEPGERRQDSVLHGLQAMQTTPDLVCIHDAARPFIDSELVDRVLQAAADYGAAVAAMPVKFTLKESDSQGLVKNTPDRSRLWEVQTPQAIQPSLLMQGFQIAQQRQLTVTDDAALVELCHYPVKLVQGSYGNIKITTPEDLAYAEYIVGSQKSEFNR